MRKPYLIRVPPFDVASGGIRAVYGLYGYLLAKGEVAYLNTRVTIPSVGIYPEIYHGNDMVAQTIVRWVLQTPGVMGTNTATGLFQKGPDTEEIKKTSDHVYVFSKIYDTIGVPEDHILFLPIINLKIFKRQNKLRTKTCYLVGKGVNQRKHPDNSIELTRYLATDQQALADLLNECQVLYCYDRLSAMMDIARLCGCKVRYYGDFEKDKLKLYETGMNGLTYKEEPEEKLNAHKFLADYMEMIVTFDRRLDKFIETTQA